MYVVRITDDAVQDRCEVKGDDAVGADACTRF